MSCEETRNIPEDVLYVIHNRRRNICGKCFKQFYVGHTGTPIMCLTDRDCWMCGRTIKPVWYDDYDKMMKARKDV